ncbi:bifunctional folylpolyglutamate synthase/dihydrofolate synthase [Bacillus testis]|uniref:bifunctional folylpolyglutamate synthase/dihydrofolate synthase n=1 Tax=Bacillus testis TaxID=1622072 RepID=UPI00067EFAF7|nr:folylpolyglutamate synthase/dihydrofolate synthase family protein [Bacillus testis]
MLTKIEDMYTYLAEREQQHGMNFGLERMDDLLDGLQVDHQSLRFVHLAGTNGKGSTLHELKKILVHAGYQVGTFTSPHIESIQERIMINERYIEEADFLRLFNKVVSYVEGMEQHNIFPTQFEILTVIALMYFVEQKPDIVLMETGLGGRLDSTNVISPLMSIITNVSYDHMNILGDTIEKIAFEKAGIIKADRYVITGAKHPDALGVIREKARQQNSRLFVLGEDFKVESSEPVKDGELFSYKWDSILYEDLKVSMLGKHQTENASLAITAALLLKKKFNFVLQEQDIREGLAHANWKGRLEVLSTDPYVIVDGSHNEDGMRTLVNTLYSRFAGKRLIIVTAALKDKDVRMMTSMLKQVADFIIFTEFDMDRALDAKSMAEYSTGTDHATIEQWEKALDRGLEMADGNSVLLITGSLYFLYYARPYLAKRLDNE